jgi:acyl-coenzyme A synthetase/AMP-(fatty) acid ligase
MPAALTIPLLRFHSAEGIFAWQDGKAISARRFLTDVASLAEQLPASPHVLNLCADRYCFAVGFAAAMLRNQASLLPPNLTPDLINRLSAQYPQLYCLTDSLHNLGSLPTLRYPDLSNASMAQIAMPEIPAEQVAAIVFTSGSTGNPMPNEKTWGAISRSVTAEAGRLGILKRSDLTLLGTIPPQHMYGFESTVLIAMQGGVILHAAKPFFPADISASLNQIPGPRALVTTPVHLRTLIASNTALPKLELIVCATAPLSRELAVQAEQEFGAPLIEIYGFTEAGQIASRHTATTDEWRTFDGLSLHQKDDLTYVSGGHVVGELALNDITELHGETTFLLHGRNADLINIAGKRTSLSSLNHHLNTIKGVQDGVFFMPDEKMKNTARLTAFVVAPGLDTHAILQELRQRVDPVFLPRPLHKVDALPRNATGKLPHASLHELLQQCSGD